MRIAQVSPLHESVPPKLYGGTERVVSHLTDELVRMGHEVTLFASGDSVTSARLIAPIPQALRLAPRPLDCSTYHVLLIESVLRHIDELDLIHFHFEPLQYPFVRRLQIPALTTLHGRLDLPDLPLLYREFADVPVVSISAAQRRPLPWLSWVDTIHHGLPSDELYLGSGTGGYLAFLGRISPEKRPDRAIQIARAAGMELRIAAKVDEVDKSYFEDAIEPLLGQPGVSFIGEVDERGKQELLGNALAVLFPIDWPEPFGLVMIEALACGTPVIAFRCGSVPEVMDDGVTGFVVDSVEEAVLAVEQARSLDRAAIRRVFEQRFTARRMAEDYLALYQRLLENSPPGIHPGNHSPLLLSSAAA